MSPILFEDFDCIIFLNPPRVTSYDWMKLTTKFISLEIPSNAIYVFEMQLGNVLYAMNIWILLDFLHDVLLSNSIHMFFVNKYDMYIIISSFPPISLSPPPTPKAGRRRRRSHDILPQAISPKQNGTQQS